MLWENPEKEVKIRKTKIFDFMSYLFLLKTDKKNKSYIPILIPNEAQWPRQYGVLWLLVSRYDGDYKFAKLSTGFSMLARRLDV